MNQVQVWQFGLILRQEGATASRKPLECLRTPKTAKKPKKCQKWAPLGPPWGGPGGPLFALGALALWGSTSGAVYTGHYALYPALRRLLQLFARNNTSEK